MKPATDQNATPSGPARAEKVAEPVPAAARRALAEAAERRRLNDCDKDLPKEVDGRGGPEPVRYGDWEVKGLASDF